MPSSRELLSSNEDVVKIMQSSKKEVKKAILQTCNSLEMVAMTQVNPPSPAFQS